MLNLPHSREEWVIAVASALTGFFCGGAAIATVQKLLKRFL